MLAQRAEAKPTVYGVVGTVDDPHTSSIPNPDFNGAMSASWDNRPFLDNASNMAAIGPQPATKAAQSSVPASPTNAVAAVTAKLGNLSKAEWIGIAVLAAMLLL
jgi:hypothetical protein